MRTRSVSILCTDLKTCVLSRSAKLSYMGPLSPRLFVAELCYSGAIHSQNYYDPIRSTPRRASLGAGSGLRCLYFVERLWLNILL